MIGSIIHGVINPLKRLKHDTVFASFVLLGVTVIALVWANSPFAHSYHELWETHMALSFGDLKLDQNLHHWINDGLMAVFFFVVGLEIKREVLYGELSDIKKAGLPIIAAFGGMIVPAVIYLMYNVSPETNKGWGIPMATDIAFALGILAILGKRVPVSLKVFLTALAIADDIGAVAVIAIFYSFDISAINIILGTCFLAIMIVANISGVKSKYFYAVVGILGVWLAFLLSGVHATVAGVLAAFTIPANNKISKEKFTQFFSYIKHNFINESVDDQKMLSKEQMLIVKMVKNACKNVEPPLQALEYSFEPWVKFFIMPLFALANAGVTFSGDFSTIIGSPVCQGVGLGLLLGKCLGITGFSFIACKLKISELPKGVNWRQIIGVSLIAGIGFTMSIFIANLAFEDAAYQMAAKTGVFLGSIVAATIGYMLLRFGKPTE